MLFELLCKEPCFQHTASDQSARSSLKKRLQRGRKFDLLVKVFGVNVLYAVPEVSVSRLDAVKLEDLVQLGSGSIEGVKVKRILQKMVTL